MKKIYRFFILAFFAFSPLFALAEGEYFYENPIEAEDFPSFIESFLLSVQSLVGYLTVLAMVICGVIYIVSFGSKLQTLAKEGFTAALIGFAIAVAAPSILNEINSLGDTGGTEPSASSFSAIATNLMNSVLGIFGVIAMIGFVVGGIMMLVGNKEKGKQIVKYSIIGVAVAGGGLIILNQILSILSAN